MIPRQVEPDLWNEHFARYAYAARYSAGRRVLDVGCGTGYGTEELARQASFATGLDRASEALEYARPEYPDVRWVQASADGLPFQDASFDLVTAFEVIEHLRDWRAFLGEVKRVLAPQGLFFVSTPNQEYYRQSRAESGPNPFHEHEFTYQEFAEELAAYFPQSLILQQNHTAGVAVSGGGAWEVSVASTGKVETAHFYLAVCSDAPLPRLHSFLYLPEAGNLLQQREEHIHKLEGELEKKNAWIAEARQERDQLLQHLREQAAEHAKHVAWAKEIDAELHDARQRIVALQDELTTTVQGYEQKVHELDEENRQKTAWAQETEARLTAGWQATAADLAAKCDELARCVAILQETQQTLDERTEWAQRLTQEREQLTALVNLTRSSRWVQLGRKLGVGPELPSL